MTKKKPESLTKAQLEAISRAEAELKAFKRAKTTKIVFCNIAWMKHYHGITENDKPRNGGSFVAETGDAWESLNFSPRNHVCYGFVQHRGNNLNLERVENGAAEADAIHDVTVVWVATGEDGRRIVGWYEHADMYREWQTFFDNTLGEAHTDWDHVFRANEQDVFLIPENERDFEIPTASQAGQGRGMGQSHIWYADSDSVRKSLIPKVLDYLRSAKKKCPPVYPSREDLTKTYEIFADTPEPLEQLAETLSEHGEHLMAIQILNRAMTLSDASFRQCFHRGVALEKFLLYDEAAEAFKEALLKMAAEKREHDLEVECFGHLSWIYQLTNQYFLAWHIEERLLAIADCEEDAALALYNMMCIAINGDDTQHARKALKQYDRLNTSYYADEVNGIRKNL
ncbi:MAG: hypothetical protein IJ812_06040 [Schwartzia sp.]|nr:hypothetical protein [Schwartzia sp. (in: firmicutes)]